LVRQVERVVTCYSKGVFFLMIHIRYYYKLLHFN